MFRLDFKFLIVATPILALAAVAPVVFPAALAGPFLEDCLDPETRGASQSHLKDCESARREVDTWGWIQRNCIGHREVPTEPDATLEAWRAPGSRKRSSQLCSMHESTIRSARPLRLICVLLPIAAAAVGLWRLLPLPDTPSEIARDYRSIRSGTLHLERHAEDPTELDRPILFHTRCAVSHPSDRPAGPALRLMGGRVHQLINRRSVLYGYQGRSGELLLCEMFVGDMTDLARGGVLRECQNKKLIVCSDNEINLVFRQDKKAICVLPSDIDSERLLQAAVLEACIEQVEFRSGDNLILQITRIGHHRVLEASR
jgi:hypothetical protein